METIDTAWTYDALDRLTGESADSSNNDHDYADTYTYDLQSNRMTKAHTGPGGGASQATVYQYNADDQLIAEGVDADSDGVPDAATATTYAYDDNGSMLTATMHADGAATHVTTYTYDVRNKLVGYSDGATAVTYVYDEAGNRVQEMVTVGVGTETPITTTTYYLTDTMNPTGYDQPIEAKDASDGTVKMTYLIGDRVFGQVDHTGTTSYLLTDGHGSTIALADVTGSVTDTFQYDAFGGAINFTPPIANTVFLFGGDAVYDPSSGLYLHGNGIRARFDFRFVQLDSYAGSSQDPISLHKYLYAGADTINTYDPSGHMLLDLLATAAITAGEYAADVGASAMALGFAGMVASALTYMSASIGLSIAANEGDSDGVAYFSNLQTSAFIGIEAGASVLAVGAGLSVIGAALTFAGTAAFALSSSQSALTTATNAQAAAILKALPPGQISAVQSWLGTGIGGRLVAGIAPATIDTATLLAYKSTLLANIARGVQDPQGVMQASIDAINATLQARGI